MKKILTPTLLATLLLSAGMSHADLIIYEPFDYEPGNLEGKTANPGTGLTGTYSDTGSSPPDFAVTGTSLSYGSHPTSGGSASYVDSLGSGSGNVSHAISILTSGPGSLAEAGLLADGAELWFSVLQRTTNNTAHDGFAFALGTDPLTNNTNFSATGAQGVGFAISAAGNLTARVSSGPTTHAIGTEINRFSLAETILIVCKITWGASSDTVVDMYLPDTSMNLGSVVSSAAASVDQSLLDTLSFHTRRQGSADPTLITNVGLDEIRFGSTLADVLPSAIATGTSFPLTITQNASTPGSFDFEWDSQPGKIYDLLTSTDLATPISEWPIYDDGVTVYESIPSAGETTTLTAVPSTDPRRFFAMRETDEAPASN